MAIIRGFPPAASISAGVSRVEPEVAYSKEDLVEEGGYYFVELPKKGIITKYGKKLLKEGAKFYSRLNISDFNEKVYNPQDGDIVG